MTIKTNDGSQLGAELRNTREYYTWADLPKEFGVAVCAWDRDCSGLSPKTIHVWGGVFKAVKYSTNSGYFLWVAVSNPKDNNGYDIVDWDAENEYWIRYPSNIPPAKGQ